MLKVIKLQMVKMVIYYNLWICKKKKLSSTMKSNTILTFIKGTMIQLLFKMSKWGPTWLIRWVDISKTPWWVQKTQWCINSQIIGQIESKVMLFKSLNSSTSKRKLPMARCKSIWTTLDMWSHRTSNIIKSIKVFKIQSEVDHYLRWTSWTQLK